jgi:hypothetical protein
MDNKGLTWKRMDTKNNKAPDEFGEAINRLDEIKEEIIDLVNEAAKIIRTKVGKRDLIYQRAEAYWVPNIRKQLNDDEQSYGTIESTIIEMEKRLEKMKEEAEEA